MSVVPDPIMEVLDTFRTLANNPPLYLASVMALASAVDDLAEEARRCEHGWPADECRVCAYQDAMEEKGCRQGEINRGK